MSLTNLFPNRDTEKLVSQLKTQNAFLSKKILVAQKKAQSFKLATNPILEPPGPWGKSTSRLYVVKMQNFTCRKVVCHLKHLSKQMDSSSLYCVNICIFCVSERRSVIHI